MDISWTWLGIAVLALIAAACIMGFRKGFVKEIVSVFFMLISFLLVWAVNPYVNTFVKEYTPVYDTIQDKCQTLVSEQIGNKKTLDKEEQNQVMENMELPDLLKNALVENNTAETYRYLAVSTFTEYISDSLAVMADKRNFFFDFFCAFCRSDQAAGIYSECSDKASGDQRH